MKTKLLILVSFFCIQFAHAQDARSILDKASAAYNNARGVKVSFTIDTKDSKAKTTYSQDGVALMEGNKFKIEVPDGITWFDGKTQWVYAKGGSEVNVSQPSGSDLAAVSPAFILNMYKQGFKLNYKGEKHEKGKTVLVVEMTPQKKADVSSFILTVDKSNYLFTSVTVNGKDGNSHLIVNKLQTGLNLPSGTFSFNKAEYPKVDIVDLR